MNQKVVMLVLGDYQDLLHTGQLDTLPCFKKSLELGVCTVLTKQKDQSFLSSLFNLECESPPSETVPEQNFDQKYDSEKVITQLTGLRTPVDPSVYRHIAMGSTLKVLVDSPAMIPELAALQIDYQLIDQLPDITQQITDYDMLFIQLAHPEQHLSALDSLLGSLLSQEIYVSVALRHSFTHLDPQQCLQPSRDSYPSELHSLIPEQSYLLRNGGYNELKGLSANQLELCLFWEYQKDMVRRDTVSSFSQADSLPGLRVMGHRNQHCQSIFKQFLYRQDRDMKFGS